MICSGASPKELVLQPRKKQGQNIGVCQEPHQNQGLFLLKVLVCPWGEKWDINHTILAPNKFGLVSLSTIATLRAVGIVGEKESAQTLPIYTKKKRFKKIKCPTAISGLRVQTFNSAPPASVTFLDGLCFLKGFQASPLHKSKARGDMKNLSLQRAHQVQDTPWDISVPVINWSPRRTFHKLF